MKPPPLRTLLALGVLLMVASGGYLWHKRSLDGLDGLLASFALEEDTIYASGYSDGGFRSVQIGMTEKEVLCLLGEPLDRYPLPDADGEVEEGMRWSKSKNGTHFRCRVVIFRSGKVLDKHAEFYID